MYFLLLFFLGGNRFIEDIEMMIGVKRWIFWLWWRICWFVIIFIFLIVSINIVMNLVLIIYIFKYF